ncbi:MAG: hypothetical protein IH802_10145, partial [Nitrospinae bacterium]|nr:hypothetical protein [Nitrospinota bacterium]
LWMKGEESGNVQEIREIYYDCDMDTILYLVEQSGVACHTGERTCFYRSLDGDKEAPSFGPSNSEKTLDDVYAVIQDRKLNPKEGSYVSGLFAKGLDKILKKVGEEAGAGQRDLRGAGGAPSQVGELLGGEVTLAPQLAHHAESGGTLEGRRADRFVPLPLAPHEGIEIDLAHLPPDDPDTFLTINLPGEGTPTRLSVAFSHPCSEELGGLQVHLPAEAVGVAGDDYSILPPDVFRGQLLVTHIFQHLRHLPLQGITPAGGAGCDVVEDIALLHAEEPLAGQGLLILPTRPSS